MQVTKIEVDDTLQEIARHGTYDFPIVIYTDQFKLFEEGQIRWHWHRELQFSFCLEDSVIVSIGNQNITLKMGEGILINSNVLHQIKPVHKMECRMFSIVFDASLISGFKQSIIETKYLSPIINNGDLKYVTLRPEIPWQDRMLSDLEVLFATYHEKSYGYELEIKIRLANLWLNLIKQIKDMVKQEVGFHSRDEERVKIALQYIHENFAEGLSLEEIAAKANISKSECCRSFQRILQMTPFEYLMEYRIIKASELLLNSANPISSIALDVGFNGMSYFGKVFKSIKGCSPSDYRNQFYVRQD